MARAYLVFAVLVLKFKGNLLGLGRQIKFPVIAVYGDYDPHPYEGVKEPLSRVIKDFKLILLENCGHTPWFERKAKNKFYEIMKQELKKYILSRRS